MNITEFKPSRVRMILAGFTALAGGVVSVAMTEWGGPMSRHLPVDEGFHFAALLGAGLAGFICAGGFGRGGRRGWALAGVISCIATLLGAVIGATLMTAYFGFLGGAPFGLLAVIDASSSLVALAIWAVAMSTLHLAARKVRAGRFSISP